MKNFLSSTKGKIIAAGITVLLIAAVVVLIVLNNTGYRSIQVEDLNGTTEITAGSSVSEAFKGQNLRSGSAVSVGEESDLTLALDSDKHVYAAELTEFRLEALGKAGKDSRTVIYLEEGSVLNEIDEKLLDSETYEVNTPNATMAVRGTTFSVSVSFDEDGFCYTTVEVIEGEVVVTELDEDGEPTDHVETLSEGEATEIITQIGHDNSGGTKPDSSSPDTDYEHHDEKVYDDPEAVAVQNAIEAYFNGAPLDNTNFDRVTSLYIVGNCAVVELDEYRYGKGAHLDWYPIDETEGNRTIEVIYSNDFSTELEKKETTYNTLENLEFLSTMKSLRSFHLFYGNLTSLSGIEGLPKIRELFVCNTELSDISALSGKTSIGGLGLSNNRISDISVISGLDGLYSVDVSGNQITEIPSVPNPDGLLNFSADGNLITDISALKNTAVKQVTLNGNQITDISPLLEATSVEELVIGNNPIADYSPLSEMTWLKHLYFSGEQDFDYSVLYGMQNLEGIHINNIRNISPDIIENLKSALPNTEFDLIW